MSGDRSQGISGAEFAGIGVQFAATILVFTFVGVWLKNRVAGSPGLGAALLILFVCLGAAGGFYSIYGKVRAAQQRDQARRAADRARESSGSEGPR